MLKQGISNPQPGVILILLTIHFEQLLIKLCSINFNIIIKPKLRYLHYTRWHQIMKQGSGSEE